ncbi:MAG: oligosaccharide flippase family protein [Candidatus Micrarchaeia archaeon]
MKKKPPWYLVVARENVFAVAAQYSTVVTSLVYVWFFPTLLGSEGFGLLSLVIAVSSLWLFFTEFGIGMAALYFIPQRHGERAWAYFRFFEKSKWMLSALAAALLFLLAPWIALGLKNPSLSEPIKVSALLTALYSLSGFYATVFSALRKSFYTFLTTATHFGLRAILPFIFFFAFGGFVSVLWAFVLSAAASLTLAIALLYAKRRVLFPNFETTIEGMPKVVRRYFAYGTLVTFNYLISMFIDAPITALFLPASAIGIFRTAFSWANFPNSVFPFSSAVFVSSYARKPEKKAVMYKKTLQYGLAFSFWAVLGIALLAPGFVKLVYGIQYAEASTLLVYLSPLTIAFTLFQAADMLLTGTGRIDISARINFATTVLQVLLYVTLIPVFGLMGIVASILAMKFLSAGVITAYALRHADIPFDVQLLLKPAVASLICLLVLSQLLAGFESSWRILLFFGLVATLAYGLLLFLFRAVEPAELLKIARGAIRI